MDFIKKNKKWIIGAVAILLVFVAYNAFFAGVDPRLLISEKQIDSDVGSEMLALLEQINSIGLDTSFFDDPVFGSLVDFGQELNPQPVGRPNPFAPIGVDI